VSDRGHARPQGGFTLIELMVALAVAAVLTAMAIAAYDFANVKTRRGAAKGCLLEAAQAMERYDADHFSYEDATLPACSTDLDGHYVLGFASGEPTADTYRIEAVPQGAQGSADDDCGTLSIDNTGVKGAGDGSASAIGACW
jgi:type IV pilus assembly protein PilE